MTLRRAWAALATFLLLLVVAPAPRASAEDGESRYAPDRYGAALGYYNAYDPVADLRTVLLHGFALLDHDKVWWWPAPDPLRFKVEGNLGMTVSPKRRLHLAVNMMALYYLDAWGTASLRPFGEAGIGVIYTDYQVKGQGLRVNFNPQAGFGVEGRGETPWFATLRLHHLSNGNLHSDNRGINGAMLLVGRYF